MMELNSTIEQHLESVHHQDILHALAHKALDKDDPLRSPVAYMLKCCERIRSGDFQPVGPPHQPPVSKPNEPNHCTVTSNLHGEIHALEQGD